MSQDNNINTPASINDRKEGVFEIRSLFINKKGTDFKLSGSMTLVGTLREGEVVRSLEYLPANRRFKFDLAPYQGNNSSFISKLQSMSASMGIEPLKTDNSLELLQSIHSGFMDQKQGKRVPLLCISGTVNPVIQSERIGNESHGFQWFNSLYFKPVFYRMLNPQAPQQGELY